MTWNDAVRGSESNDVQDQLRTCSSSKLTTTAKKKGRYVRRLVPVHILTHIIIFIYVFRLGLCCSKGKHKTK